MTNDEMNRKISEARDEWFEVVDEWDHNGRTTRSHSSPLDWTGSEDASAVLLEEVPFVVVRRSNLPHGTGMERWYVGTQAQPKKQIHAWWAESTDRKTAIALAWLKWKGLT